MSKPSASGGNEPPPFTSVGQMFDAKKKAIKARPRPTRRAWSYVYHFATATITIATRDHAWLMSEEARKERDFFEADLKMWYEQQKVCQEPYLKGETFDQYRLRTGSDG